MTIVRQWFSEYGTFLALLLMCVILSVLTLKEQQATDPAAARRLAHQLADELKPGQRVLIVGRDNQEDRQFGDVLQAELETARLQVTRVHGAPKDARQELVALVESQETLAAVAGNQVTADWFLFQSLDTDFPELGKCRVVKPQPYLWPTFLKSENLLNVANQISVIAIIAVGMTFVIIAGGIDLSVGSLIALSSVVAALLIRRWGGTEASVLSMCLGSLAGIIVCGLVGAFSGLMVISMDIPPFIVTLAMMMSASGAAFLLADGHSIPEVPASYVWLGRETSWWEIPNAVVLMAVTYLLASLLLRKTVLGRYVYAVGGNHEAARLSGIPHRWVILFTFVASGLLAGVGGIVFASTYQSGDP
ncbi:MAG: ABC transporter permease, partial [Planctomycetales bacterium]|nr:ABC transporter permease [Planctomycetales bacterium]